MKLSDNSIGWVVRYGGNKVGIANYYKQANTNVFVLFNGDNILEEALITNDSPEEYKVSAERLIASEVSGQSLK